MSDPAGSLGKSCREASRARRGRQRENARDAQSLPAQGDRGKDPPPPPTPRGERELIPPPSAPSLHPSPQTPAVPPHRESLGTSPEERSRTPSRSPPPRRMEWVEFAPSSGGRARRAPSRSPSLRIPGRGSASSGKGFCVASTLRAPPGSFSRAHPSCRWARGCAPGCEGPRSPRSSPPSRGTSPIRAEALAFGAGRSRAQRARGTLARRPEPSEQLGVVLSKTRLSGTPPARLARCSICRFEGATDLLGRARKNPCRLDERKARRLKRTAGRKSADAPPSISKGRPSLARANDSALDSASRW